MNSVGSCLFHGLWKELGMAAMVVQSDDVESDYCRSGSQIDALLSLLAKREKSLKIFNSSFDEV